MGRRQSSIPSSSTASAGTFIDLFAGCGGLTLGLLDAGWQGLFGIEVQADAFATYSANFINGPRYSLEWPAWLPQSPWDIKKLLAEHESNLRRLRGKVDLVCGGPPCQGFSFSGQRDPHDPRNQMFRRYVDLVNIVRPKFLLLENVPGFQVAHGNSAHVVKKSGRKSYAEKLRELLEPTYVFDDCLVRSSRFGVPQVRDRYFAIGIRRDLAFEQGEDWAANLIEGIRDGFLEHKGLPQNPISAKQAIGDLEIKSRPLVPYCPDDTCGTRAVFMEAKYSIPNRLSPFLQLMRADLNGQAPSSRRLPRHKDDIRERFEYILRNCQRGKTLDLETRERLGLKKIRFVPLEANEPARTVTTLPDDLLHYSEPRILTVRECARLQSFPDWFEFHGKYTTGGHRRKVECPRYTQVGNAVPPLVAEAWGVALGKLLKRLR
jgi:DNA (cytosine-5)-methyltransferase 1